MNGDFNIIYCVRKSFIKFKSTVVKKKYHKFNKMELGAHSFQLSRKTFYKIFNFRNLFTYF